MTALHARIGTPEWHEECRDYADLGPAYTKPDLSGVPLHVERTCHWRVCPECQGAGEVTVNASHNNDPQCDEPCACPNPDCEDGEIVEWVDPLIRLRDMRRTLLRDRRSPLVNAIYGECRQEAVSMVTLPDAPVRFCLERAA